MKKLIEKITNLFARTRGASKKLPLQKQNEILTMLEDSINKVTAGTAKIDEQIAQLRAIEKQLDDADEMIAPLDNLLGEFSTKTGASPEEARRVLIEKYNEGYPPGSPKRMSDEDDDRLRAYIESQKLMGNEQDLMIDVLENAQLPDDQLRAIREIAEEGTSPFKQVDVDELLSAGDKIDQLAMPSPSNIPDEILDDMIKATQQKKTDLARVEELMANPDNFGKSFDEILQMVQDEKVIPINRTKKSMGGLAKLFAKMGMKSPDKVGDVKQTKNIIRDEGTDLSRRSDTPEGKQTIDELEQMFMDDPRYKGADAKAIQKLIDKEKIRADVSYNMGVDPKEIPDDMIEMLYQDGYHLNFANGGGVGSLFKRRK